MSDTNNNNNGFMYFIIGVLLVAVLVIGYMLFMRNNGQLDLDGDDETTFELTIEDDGISGSVDEN